MTPTASRLQARLDERRRWFSNEWFFKWHFIGRDGPVSIDSFDGRGIHYGGIGFDGTARLVYWEAIVRDVRKELDDQISWIDEHVRNYNNDAALSAIDECAGQLISFVRAIRREAVAKDRILRGDGIKFPPEDDAGRWDSVSDKWILSQARALAKALPNTPPPQINVLPPPMTKRQRATAVWNENQWWLGPIAFLIGLAGILPLVF